MDALRTRYPCEFPGTPQPDPAQPYNHTVINSDLATFLSQPLETLHTDTFTPEDFAETEGHFDSYLSQLPNQELTNPAAQSYLSVIEDPLNTYPSPPFEDFYASTSD